MFDNPWATGAFQNQNLDQLQAQYQSQLDTLNRMKVSQTSIMDDINRELGGLSKEEQGFLYETPEYKEAKAIYEAGFLQFISSKFSVEYLGTQAGKESAENLLSVIKKSKEKISYQAKAREDKINKVLEMLEKDPEMRKKYNELYE